MSMPLGAVKNEWYDATSDSSDTREASWHEGNSDEGSRCHDPGRVREWMPDQRGILRTCVGFAAASGLRRTGTGGRPGQVRCVVVPDGVLGRRIPERLH